MKPGIITLLIHILFSAGTISAQVVDSVVIEQMERDKERLLKILEQELGQQQQLTRQHDHEEKQKPEEKQELTRQHDPETMPDPGADRQPEISDPAGFSVLFPERVPGWIMQMPDPPENSLYVMGISDPGMDEVAGHELAKLRISVAGALLRGAVVSNMRDFYSLEEQDGLASVFVDYTGFESSFNGGLAEVRIIESHVTQYGETVLLGEVTMGEGRPDTSSSALFTVSAGILSHAREAGTRAVINGRIDLDVMHAGADGYPDTLHSYRAWQAGNRVNSETILAGREMYSLPAMSLRYAGSAGRGREDENAFDPLPFGGTGHSLRHGLWYAYLNAILFELAELAYGDAIHLASLDEVFGNMSQRLIRELVSTAVGCQRKRITIDGNRMYMRCD